jgi:lipoprotein-anchoring transpeptidase ErfK/SrfK
MARRVYKLHLVQGRRRGGVRRRGWLVPLAGVAFTALVLAGGWWLGGQSPVTLPSPHPPAARPSPSAVAPALVPVAPVPAVAESRPRPATSAVPVVIARQPQPTVATAGGRPVKDVLEAQLALDRLGISCGSIDGVMGPQTRAALEVFQRTRRLPVTGELDAATRAALFIAEPVFTEYTVTAADLGGLRTLGRTWTEKAAQDRLGYESLLEQLAERSHASPNLLRRLNPGVDWSQLQPGASVNVLRVEAPPDAGRAAQVRVRLAARALQAFDTEGRLLAHFPCSIAARMDKRITGQLRVTVLAPDPDYTFDPALFPESAEARHQSGRLMIPPGPNNPVGTAWIGLDRPGYGIHGTPQPEQVGRTESHGCFRLANWNAERLLRLAWVGMPVIVEP